MLFTGTVLLGYPESEFWELTPRKFCALTDCLEEYNRMTRGGASGKKNKAKGVDDGFIDEIVGW